MANSAGTAVSCSLTRDAGLSPPYCGGPVSWTVLKLSRQSEVLEWGRSSWGIFWVFLSLVLGYVCDALNVCGHRAESVDVCVQTTCVSGRGLYSLSLASLREGASV